MVFEQVEASGSSAAIVQRPSGSSPWPVLCSRNRSDRACRPGAWRHARPGPALTHAATGAPETAAAAAPFAVNSFFSGPGSFTVQSATQITQDRAGG